MNLILVVIVSALLACGAYMLNIKMEKKEVDKVTIIKMGVLGVCIGVLNYLILCYINPSKISIEEFNTGKPKF